MCSMPDYLREQAARGLIGQWLPRPTQKHRKQTKRGRRARPGNRGPRL
jgi:hypothetical protein